MKRAIAISLVALAAVSCGKDETGDNNTSTNNGSNNAANNQTSNQNTSNQPNNQTSNNQTNNNQTTGTNNTNQMTTNTTGNPLECDVDFGMDDACGGNPRGDWTVSAVCSRTDFSMPVTDLCPDAMIVGTQDLDGTGTLSVTQTTFTQELSGTVSISVDLPQGCEFNDCDLAEGALQSDSAVDQASCNDLGADGCACTVTVAFEEMVTSPYTVSGGTITLDGGEAYSYCARDGTMLLRESDALYTTLYAGQ